MHLAASALGQIIMSLWLHIAQHNNKKFPHHREERQQKDEIKDPRNSGAHP